MREIKVRGKCVKTGGMVYGYLFPRSMIEDPDFLAQFWIATGFENECYPVGVNTIGQFTGLHDKNGKEIYEGDIIRLGGNTYDLCYYANQNVVVEWFDGLTGFKPFNDTHSDYDTIDPESCEVIGNINENKDLLK